MHARDRLLTLVTELIFEGESVLQTTYAAPGNWASCPPHYVDLRAYSRWRASCLLLSRLLGPAGAAWQRQLEGKAENGLGSALRLQGVLEAIQDAIQKDLLHRFEDLIFAEAFSDLIDQADYLFEYGYALAAGVIYRAVLEEHLRRLCDKHQCMPAKLRPTLADYNAELYKATAYDKVAMKHVESMAATGNMAAHNDPALSPVDVGRLKRDVRDFLHRFQ